MTALWPIALTAASVVALAEGCGVVALYAGLGRLLFRMDPSYKPLITDDGPAVNDELPPLAGEDPRTHEPVAAAEFRDRKLVVLFVSPGCDPSAELLAAVRERRRGWRDSVAFLVVVGAPAPEAAAYLEDVPAVPAIADPDGQIFRACGVERTPFGLLVDFTGHVRMKGVVNTRDQLAGLIAGQGRPMAGLAWAPAADGEPASGEGVPEPAPALDGSSGPSE